MIDAKKMAKFAKGKPGGNFGGEKKPPFPPPKKKDDEGNHDASSHGDGEEEEEDDEDEGEEEHGGADEGSEEHFLEELAEHSDVIEDMLDSMGDDVDELSGESDLSPDVAKKVKNSVAQMPGDLREGFKKFVKGKSIDEVEEMCDKLEDDGKITGDIGEFASWMFHAAKMV